MIDVCRHLDQINDVTPREPAASSAWPPDATTGCTSVSARNADTSAAATTRRESTRPRTSRRSAIRSSARTNRARTGTTATSTTSCSSSRTRRPPRRIRRRRGSLAGQRGSPQPRDTCAPSVVASVRCAGLAPTSSGARRVDAAGSREGEDEPGQRWPAPAHRWSTPDEGRARRSPSCLDTSPQVASTSVVEHVSGRAGLQSNSR